MKDEEGGEFVVVLSNPMNHYDGTSQNSINSKELHMVEPFISYTLKHAKRTYDLKCDTVGTDPMFENATGAM